MKKILITVILLSFNGYAEEIKKWKDSSGNVHFGDSLPGKEKIYSNVHQGSSSSSNSVVESKEEKLDRLSKNLPTQQYDKNAEPTKDTKKGMVRLTFDGLPLRSKENIISTLNLESRSLFELYNSISDTGKKQGGDLTVELQIFPDGSVVYCKILASSLENKEIEGKLVEKIRTMKFSSDNVKPTNYTHTFKFL